MLRRSCLRGLEQFSTRQIQVSRVLTFHRDRSCATEVYLRRLIRVSDAEDHIPVACQMLHQQLVLRREAELEGVIEQQHWERPMVRCRNGCMHMRVRGD